MFRPLLLSFADFRKITREKIKKVFEWLLGNKPMMTSSLKKRSINVVYNSINKNNVVVSSVACSSHKSPAVNQKYVDTYSQH